MNFIEEIDKLIKSKRDDTEKITVLCNILLPKLMYIPTPQIVAINLRIASFQNQFSPSTNHYYLIQSCRALLEYRQFNFQEAIEYIEALEHLDYSEFETNNLSMRNLILGISYRSLGNKNKALDAFQMVVDKELDMTNVPKYQSFGYGLSLYHIAEMYGEMQEFEAMLVKFQQLLPFSEQTQNIDLNNRCLNGLGRAYLALEDYENALKFLKLADKQGKKQANPPFISRNLHDLGGAYAQLKQYDVSLNYYQQSLNLRKSTKYSNAVITTLMSMSEVHIEQKSYHQAIDLLHEALGIAVPLKVNSKIYKIYEYLSIIYEHQGEFEKALTYFKKFHSLKEDTENVSSTQAENQKIREINSKLRKQKKLIETQKYQIETSVNKLKEANRYLENFATVAAHDLKAPMRIAGNFSKIIERKYKTLIDVEDKEYLSFISGNMTRLSRMIDDLLSLSKIDQNLSKAEIVDTQETVNEAVLRLNVKIKESQAEVNLQNLLPKVMAHPSLVTQLFQNLIDNAVKHGASENKPTKVFVSSRLNIENTQFQEFEVRDNGKGIPGHIQPYIFDLFNGTNETDGTGIGLATCRKIVRHYGGKIWVKSEENQGTSMFFTLPAYIQ